jgi:hypothetical protein
MSKHKEKKKVLKIEPKEPTKEEYKIRHYFRDLLGGESFNDYVSHVKDQADSLGIGLDDIKGYLLNYWHASATPSALVFTADSQKEYDKDLKSYRKRHAQYKNWYEENKEAIEEELLRRRLVKEASEKKKKEAEEKRLEKELKKTQDKLKNLRNRVDKEN